MKKEKKKEKMRSGQSDQGNRPSGIFIADSLLDLWYIQGLVLQQVRIMILLI